ncbi:hypothetical protein [Bradyrhizobium sp. ARR65]|uniref:hypothetical protein n=1 Tax=Bradyrhizobium sp. ARR65 TaxID=1040989 RepID=UPI0012F78981|nr:hypothetical protein [Bradyrhizobium sp. ARR65]
MSDPEDDLDASTMPAWARVWHVWRVIIRRRSIDGGIAWGNVWRRRDDRRWIYKRLTGFDDL